MNNFKLSYSTNYFLLPITCIMFLTSCESKPVINKIAENLYEIPKSTILSTKDEKAISEIEKKYYELKDFNSNPFIAFVLNDKKSVRGGFLRHMVKDENHFRESRIFYGNIANDVNLEGLKKIDILLAKYEDKGIKKIGKMLYSIADGKIIKESDESKIEKIEKSYYKDEDYTGVPYISFINQTDVVEKRGGFVSNYRKDENKFRESRIFYGNPRANGDITEIDAILSKYIE